MIADYGELLQKKLPRLSDCVERRAETRLEMGNMLLALERRVETTKSWRAAVIDHASVVPSSLWNHS